MGLQFSLAALVSGSDGKSNFDENLTTHLRITIRFF